MYHVRIDHVDSSWHMRVGVPVPVLSEANPGMDADLVTLPPRCDGDDGAEAEDDCLRSIGCPLPPPWVELLPGMATASKHGVPGLGPRPLPCCGCSSIFRNGAPLAALGVSSNGPWWSSKSSSSVREHTVLVSVRTVESSQVLRRRRRFFLVAFPHPWMVSLILRGIKAALYLDPICVVVQALSLVSVIFFAENDI